MPDIPHSHPYRDGSPLTPARLNQDRRNLERLGRDVADNLRPPPSRSPSGPASVDTFVGVIRSTGPNGEADYSDARYWIDRAVPKQSLANGDEFDTAVETIQGLKRIVTATNLAELPPTSASGAAVTGGTHGLATLTRVQVYRFRTREMDGSAGVDQYVFTAVAGDGVFPVLLTRGAGTGAGVDPFTATQFTATYDVYAFGAIDGNAWDFDHDVGVTGGQLIASGQPVHPLLQGRLYSKTLAWFGLAVRLSLFDGSGSGSGTGGGTGSGTGTGTGTGSGTGPSGPPFGPDPSLFVIPLFEWPAFTTRSCS